MPDLDKPCPHLEFAVLAEVHRLIDDDEALPHGYYADFRIECAVCHEPFRFNGLPAGVLPNRPTCSLDAMELRAPIRPASSDPDFGLGLVGFTMAPGRHGGQRD